jgi:long-chain fatty acid transport protein
MEFGIISYLETMRTMRLKMICLFCLMAVSGGTAYADIASNFGLGANALSMSGAYTGVADDFSACYYNPGGLAFQRRPVFTHDGRGTSLSIGAGYIANMLWTKDPGSGKSSAYIAPLTFEQLGLTMGPSALAGLLPERRVYFGFAFYSPTDAIIGWKERNTATDRYFVFYDNQNRIFGFLADAAYRLSDHLAIGAGANIYAASRTITNVNFVQSSFYHTEDNVILIKAAPVAGIMINTGNGLKIGLNYRAETKFNDYGVNNLSESGLLIYTQSFNYVRFFSPEQYSIGASYRFAKHGLLVSLDAAYIRWSDFVDEQGDGMPQTSLFDTVVPRLGMRYRIKDNIRLSGGYAFIRSPVRDQTGATNFLDSNKHLVSLGAGYTFKKAGFWQAPITVSAYVQDTLFQTGFVHKTQQVAQYQQGYSFGGSVFDGGIECRFVW